MTGIILNKNLTQRRVRLQLDRNPSNKTSHMDIDKCYLNSALVDDHSSDHSSVSTLKPSLKKHFNYLSRPAKTVHFDEQLEHIYHFSIEEESNNEAVYEDDEDEEDDDEDDDDEDDEDENELEDEFLKLFLNKHYQETCETIPTESITLKEENNNLSLPSISSHPTENVVSQMVKLESIKWNNEKSVVQGSVLVQNLAYEKRVFIRSSSNDWKNYLDIEANHKDFVRNDDMDRFEFELSTLVPCAFAVCYQTQGQEFWDNNYHQNYLVQFNNVVSPLPPLIGHNDTSRNRMKRRMTKQEYNNMHCLLSKLLISSTDAQQEKISYFRSILSNDPYSYVGSTHRINLVHDIYSLNNTPF